MKSFVCSRQNVVRGCPAGIVVILQSRLRAAIGVTPAKPAGLRTKRGLMRGWRTASMGPTSPSSDDATNGSVARELPVAPALLIRRDLAQQRSSVMFAVTAFRFSSALQLAPGHQPPAKCRFVIRRKAPFVHHANRGVRLCCWSLLRSTSWSSFRFSEFWLLTVGRQSTPGAPIRRHGES